MAASAIETLLAQIQVALSGATAAGTNVTRGRADAFDRAELPAINVRRSRTEAVDFGMTRGKSVDHTTANFEIDLEVRGEDWETQADALHMQVEEILFASAGVASLARGLACTGTDATAEGGDDTAGRITARYQFQLITYRGELTRQI